jgi:phage shock protein PspC (stress-responsive transcriptional regulator)
MARRLVRNTRDAVLAGVAAGLADHLDLDPLLVRLGFIFLSFFGGAGVFLYGICWVLMPRNADLAAGDTPAGGPAPGAAGGPGDSGAPVPPADRIAREVAEAGERVVDGLRRGGPGRGRLVLGVILVVVGLLFLADRFLPGRWFWIWDLWPLIVIAIGLLILLGARREGAR